MRIVVCVKSVLKKPPEKVHGRSGVDSELNPYDLPALQLALALNSSGENIALTMGPQPAREALLDAAALGVSRGVLVCDRAIAGSDTLATSRVIAAALKKLMPFDLVLFGSRTADSDTGQVGPQTATILGLPFVSKAMEAAINDGKLEVLRRADGFKERLRVKLPAALIVHPSAFGPADLSLGRIARAYKEQMIETWNLADIGLDPKLAGLGGSPTQVRALTEMKAGKKCEFIAGPPGEQAQALMKLLAEKGLLS